MRLRLGFVTQYPASMRIWARRPSHLRTIVHRKISKERVTSQKFYTIQQYNRRYLTVKSLLLATHLGLPISKSVISSRLSPGSRGLRKIQASWLSVLGRNSDSVIASWMSVVMMPSADALETILLSHVPKANTCKRDRDDQINQFCGML